MLSQTVIVIHDSTFETAELVISLMYHNASGKKSKVHQLNDCLHWTMYNLIMIAETWYNNSVNSSNITAVTIFNLYQRDRGSNAGGVIIAIRNNITVKSFNTWAQFVHIEAIISLENENVTLLYWPPTTMKQEKDTSLDELTTLLSSLKNTSIRNVVIGDLNLPGIAWTYNTILQEMIPSTIALDKFEKALLPFPTNSVINKEPSNRIQMANFWTYVWRHTPFLSLKQNIVKPSNLLHLQFIIHCRFSNGN